MYQFLSLFGPGALTWIVRERCFTGEKAEKEDRGGRAVWICILEMLSYALVNLAVVASVFKPMGRVQFFLSADGMPTIQYGASALFGSVIVAVAIGVFDSRDVKEAGAKMSGTGA